MSNPKPQKSRVQAEFWPRPEPRRAIPLEEASRIADRLSSILSPHCEKIAVAGSIRRRRPVVNDIDLVLIPRDMGRLVVALLSAGQNGGGGDKARWTTFEGVRVDVYLATPTTWATLFLIRTGSAENNIRLCGVAKRKGMHLAASGDGLFDVIGRRIAGDTEESIYSALGLKYQQPNERA